ncbi:hypothetical protein DYB28_010221 [Aphanomyces astaci]|uniref:Uncharacterized protein n=1 Tax=Aphanomyces astaci TaxID=112090 RepID=A0A397F8J2_APHAT|nr:hypothetical protein DYB25_006192 [Aphanomyces astaci]RHY44334.1 hypothetical protein DYB30_012920 [Aphanomyces astaci]RHY46674.1 hypothetical protein DYB38_005904 [Aphanomyces astaci]RHY60189.1 hypothetical protein DYB34_006059 [Aphanomyces astaci]RHZ13958.1 hypothetical protein DYB31_016367 [Aphanomyces astaci]
MAATEYFPPLERKQRREIRKARIWASILERSDLCLSMERHRVHQPLRGSKARGLRSRGLFALLTQRERRGELRPAEHLAVNEAFLPVGENANVFEVDHHDERLYCGGFSPDGETFLVAGQSEEVHIYDTNTWKRVDAYPVRDIRWTVTDAHFTPDAKGVLYSSITSMVRMVMQGGKECAFDLAKTARSSSTGRSMTQRRRDFGVWSLGVNAAGTEFLAGTSNNTVVLHDMTTNTSVCHLAGHDDHVNAITFVDGPQSSNVFVSGSDDCLIKLWDRRMMSESNARPQGVFVGKHDRPIPWFCLMQHVGHTDGITHMSSRDDGFYFVSNAKDQSAKLWDLRKCVTDEAKVQHLPRQFQWDYRFEEYPGNYEGEVADAHPQDQSVMTYRGHAVKQTLIRAYFSPQHSTGQRYIYSGSADGEVVIYDVLSANVVDRLELMSQGVTRDVRWHPFKPMIVSPDFYGKLCVWQKEPLGHTVHDDDDDEE